MFDLEDGFRDVLISEKTRVVVFTETITAEVRHLCEPVVPARTALHAVLFDLRRCFDAKLQATSRYTSIISI
jgi:hypothetical protein